MEQQNKSNIKALVGLGVAYELAGQVDLAKQTYEQMLAIESPEAALHVAQYYSKNDRYVDALSVLDDAIKKAPSAVPLYALKASLLLQAGRSNEVVVVLEQLEKLKAGSGYPKLIALLLKQGQDAKAEKIAESVIKGNPESNYGYLLQSSIFEYKKQPSKAVEVLKQGLSTLPDDARDLLVVVDGAVLGRKLLVFVQLVVLCTVCQDLLVCWHGAPLYSGTDRLHWSNQISTVRRRA